jgi:hypothetical protein
MTVQIIRKDGKFRGIALMLGEGRIIAAMGSSDREELWRICDSCCVHEAIVFCRTHAKYVCGSCLAAYPSEVGRECAFISVSVARDLAQRAQRYAEVEG